MTRVDCHVHRKMCKSFGLLYYPTMLFGSMSEWMMVWKQNMLADEATDHDDTVVPGYAALDSFELVEKDKVRPQLPARPSSAWPSPPPPHPRARLRPSMPRRPSLPPSGSPRLQPRDD